MALLFATHSADKLRELLRQCPELSPHVVTLGELGIREVAPEEEPTFEGNALSKARFYGERAGMPALADDSGLCIDALDGGPGVLSARYLPELSWAERNLHLARTVGALPRHQRGAHYVCCLALVAAGLAPLSVRGEAHGAIAETPRGSGGFGYDPLFLVPEIGRTMAELPPAEKDGRSHRGAAMRALRQALPSRPDLWALVAA